MEERTILSLHIWYDAANCEKDLYIVDEAGHAEAKDFDVDAYWNKVFSFINEKMDI